MLQISPGLLVDNDGETIVVSKFSGWGSLLNIAPLLEGIRRTSPHSRLVLVTDSHNGELVRRLPCLDQFLFLPETGRNSPIPLLQAARLALRIRRLNPRIFLDLQLQTRKSLALNLSILSGARIRIGFVGGKDPRRLARLTHPLYFNMHQATKSVYDQASLLLGIPPAHASQSIVIERPSDARDLSNLLPDVLDNSTPLCIINPNASERAFERRWPVSQFQETIHRLLAVHRSLRIALIGSPDEREYVMNLEKGINPGHRQRVYNMAGRLSFGGLVALIRKGSCFLTNDSGPLHLALSIGTPTVGLFGPTHPGLIPARTPSSRTIFLYEPHYCSPCVHHIDRPPCGGDNICMQHISVESVVRACEAFLLKNRGTRLLPQEWNELTTPGVEEHQQLPLALFRPQGGWKSPLAEPNSASQPNLWVREQGGG
ncbi:MAG: glycosyltransferase family 9 protein [Leptospirales bacterium]